MSLGNVFASDILKLFLNGTAIADLAEDDSDSPATTLTIALHTSDPGEAGTQATNEAEFDGYARVTVARTSGGWTIAGGNPDPATASPVADIDFPECTGTPGDPITHFSVGTGVSNYLMMSGTVTPNVTMAAGVVVRLKTSSTLQLD